MAKNRQIQKGAIIIALLLLCSIRVFSQFPKNVNAMIPDVRDAYGVALADFDRDGKTDIYLVGFRTLNRLLINRGNGNFSDRSLSSGAGGNLMPLGIRNLELGASVVDYDNDGMVDILISGWGDALELLKNRGDGSFYSVTKRMRLPRDIDVNMGLWADLDKDGWLDLLLTNEHGPIKLLQNIKGSRFVEIPFHETGINPDSGSQGAVFVDLDLDGDQDLVVAGWKNPLRIFENQEKFHFQEIFTQFNFPPESRSNAVLVGDVDNDGDPDLLLTMRNMHSILFSNLANPFIQVKSPSQWEILPKPILFKASPKAFVADSNSQQLDAYGGGFVDFDCDGDLDLFLTGRGTPAFYRNTVTNLKSDSVSFEKVNGEILGIHAPLANLSTGFQAGWLDDSTSPFFVLAARDSACMLQALPGTLMNSGSDSFRFVGLSIHGVYSNRDAIGSKVSVWVQNKNSDRENVIESDVNLWKLISTHNVHGGEGYFGSYHGPILLSIPQDSNQNVRIRIDFPNGKILVRSVSRGPRTEVWEAGLVGGAYEFSKRWLITVFQDPIRRNQFLWALCLVIAILLVLRWILWVWAKSIARKEYLTQVEHNRQQLIHSEKMAALGQLVAGIAHELNNPIGFIYANLVQVDKDLERLGLAEKDEDRIKWSKRIAEAQAESREGAKRIRDIVQNLRGISRNGGKDANTLQRTPCDPNSIFEKALVLAQTSFRKDIHLQRLFSSCNKISVDETQIQQVLINLLVNAGQSIVAHRSEGGNIIVSTSQGDSWVEFGVEDDGAGIQPENRRKLFEPFFTTKPVGQGLGLGLHISYQIVQAHGGTVEVDSGNSPSLKNGALFKVRIPFVNMNENDEKRIA